jgi:enoyl-CoA hydratase/carnithine racemase
MSGDAVLIDDTDGVVTLTLNRPGVRNALTAEVAGDLRAALGELEGGDTRCVVLEGAGEAFCAGGDVNAMVEYQSGDRSLDDAVRHVIQDTGRTIQRVAECEFPTVAKVEGTAVGAGATLALACDLQVAHEDAQMGFGFRRVGLAVDSGTAHLLPRVVGDNVARELVYTGELLDAERASELGLVNRVHADDEFEAAVSDLVDRISSGPPVALRTSKRLLRRAPEMTLGAAVEHEAGAQAAVLDSEDHAEGVSAFLERREPTFRGE